MKLHRITESTDTILYRGDSSNIGEFDFDQTDSQALVGRGLYLTSSQEVAMDYTIKGSNDVIYRSDGVYYDPREFMVDVFLDLRSEQQQTFNGEFSNQVSAFVYDGNRAIKSAFPDATRTDSLYLQAKCWQELTKASMPALRALYDDTRTKFIQSLDDTRLIKTVLEEYLVVSADMVGQITRFRIPRAYLSKTYSVNNPMERWMVDWLVKYIRTKLPSFNPEKTHVDLRYNDPQSGSVRASSFNDFLRKFRKYGSQYAWSDHDIGGQGKNPSILEFLLGTHYGGTILHQDSQQIWDDMRKFLQSRGYVGLYYRGGEQTGHDTFTGGSPVKHSVYVLWDVNQVNQFVIDRKRAERNDDPKSYIGKIRFPLVKNSFVRATKRHYKDIDTYRQGSKYHEAADELITKWIASGSPITALLNVA